MELATKRFIRDDGSSPVGYGYTFWIMDDALGVPEDTFMSHGDRLNDSYIIPSLDLVVIRQGNFNPDDKALVRTELIQKIVAAIPHSTESSSINLRFF